LLPVFNHRTLRGKPADRRGAAGGMSCSLSVADAPPSYPASSVSCIEPQNTQCRLRRTGSVCTYTNLYLSSTHGWVFLRKPGTADQYETATSKRKAKHWTSMIVRTGRPRNKSPTPQLKRLDVQLWPTEPNRDSVLTLRPDSPWQPSVIEGGAEATRFQQLHQGNERYVETTTFISQLWPNNDWTQALLDNAFHLYWSATTEMPEARPSDVAVFFDGLWTESTERRNRAFSGTTGTVVAPPLEKLAAALFSPKGCSRYALHRHVAELGGSSNGAPVLTRFAKVVAGGFERHMLLSRRMSGMRRKAFYQCEPVETDATRSQKLQGFRAYVLGAAGFLAPSNRRRQLLLLNRQAPARRIVNGQEVLDVLQGVANGWGDVHAFEETNTIPFHQLIDALRVCAIAIGPQGKAIANAIFLPPGAMMVELMPEEEESNEFAQVLALLRVAHLGFPAQLGVHAKQRGKLPFVTAKGRLAVHQERVNRNATKYDPMQLIANASLMGDVAIFARGAPDTRRGEQTADTVDAFVQRARLRFQIVESRRSR